MNNVQINITPMTLEDIDEVIKIEHASFTVPWSKESFESEIKNNKHAIYIVVKQENKVIGYGGMWKIFEEGHITNVAIHPDFRRKRIGSALMEAMIKTAVDNEITLLTLEVRESNIPAQRLYSKFGFEVVGKRKNYYADNNEDALIMNVELRMQNAQL
ncbi:MAG: [ribosomal protein S18]-alanine N-acetyltransferase [Clostridiales bacterium]|nr:[ribosomal protein S18]-alanine N-acetyltransferase [Clostridiales bacterium]MDK2932512.1 [ribosomal protein S18]-alanine N-acetyltransferase [Clostridiales bacterium]